MDVERHPLFGDVVLNRFQLLLHERQVGFEVRVVAMRCGDDVGDLFAYRFFEQCDGFGHCLGAVVEAWQDM